MRAAAALGLTLVLAACATVPPRAQLVAPHYQRARALEADGRLRPALLEWKVARTIDPDDAEARANETRLAARIERLVATKVTEARAALQRGAPLQARRLLLAVLALDPANATAATLLRERVGDIEFVSHTVRPGETLSSLAERYYGDRARGEVIWEQNNLPPGRALVVGAVLRIPEIPGLPFYAPGRKAPPPAATVALPPSGAAPPRGPERPAPRQEEPPEINPLLADVRDAVEHKDFAAALADVDRYIAENPRDREGLDLKKHVLYRQAQTALDEKKYDDSYRALAQLAKLQPDYQDVATLLPQARRQVVDRHYQEGIKLFREEKLEDAIAEWRVVLELEPQHVNARRNIEQAERLLKGLEQKAR
jgi:tetratricopeptide (TPR) repeat protein